MVAKLGTTITATKSGDPSLAAGVATNGVIQPWTAQMLRCPRKHQVIIGARQPAGTKILCLHVLGQTISTVPLPIAVSQPVDAETEGAEPQVNIRLLPAMGTAMGTVKTSYLWLYAQTPYHQLHPSLSCSVWFSCVLCSQGAIARVLLTQRISLDFIERQLSVATLRKGLSRSSQPKSKV